MRQFNRTIFLILIAIPSLCLAQKESQLEESQLKINGDGIACRVSLAGISAILYTSTTDGIRATVPAFGKSGTGPRVVGIDDLGKGFGIPIGIEVYPSGISARAIVFSKSSVVEVDFSDLQGLGNSTEGQKRIRFNSKLDQIQDVKQLRPGHYTILKTEKDSPEGSMERLHRKIWSPHDRQTGKKTSAFEYPDVTLFEYDTRELRLLGAGIDPAQFLVTAAVFLDLKTKLLKVKIWTKEGKLDRDYSFEGNPTAMPLNTALPFVGTKIWLSPVWLIPRTREYSTGILLDAQTGAQLLRVEAANASLSSFNGSVLVVQDPHDLNHFKSYWLSGVHQEVDASLQGPQEGPSMTIPRKAGFQPPTIFSAGFDTAISSGATASIRHRIALLRSNLNFTKTELLFWNFPD